MREKTIGLLMAFDSRMGCCYPDTENCVLIEVERNYQQEESDFLGHSCWINLLLIRYRQLLALTGQILQD